MNNHYFNKAVGIACLSIILNLVASAQSSSSVTDLTGKTSFTKSSDSDSKPAFTKKIETDLEIAEPKVSVKHPAREFKVTARESKMDLSKIALPDADDLGETQAFHATAYSLQGRTRMGTSTRRGVIAADPRVLPLGSVVQIKSGTYTGVYVVHDTGKRMKGNIVDVWVPSRSEARQFGRRSIKVQVLKVGGKGTR